MTGPASRRETRCEAPAKGSYTPDLIVVNRARHTAYILDLKRSLASYGDTSRLEELKMKMMAAAMVLPDWLYKTQKRLMVDAVEVAIVDGASRPSDHASGVWALSEIDDLLEIDGVAACMAELRRRFGQRVQQLLEAEALKALGLDRLPLAGMAVVTSEETAPTRPRINLNGPSRSFEEDRAARALDDDADRDEPDPTTRLTQRVTMTSLRLSSCASALPGVGRTDRASSPESQASACL